MAVATFEATEAAASVVFSETNYFDQLNFKYESRDYIAVTQIVTATAF